MERVSKVRHRHPFYFWSIGVQHPMKAICLFALLGLATGVRAGGPFEPIPGPSPADSIEVLVEDERLISSALAVLLGPFGAHRIYLGTSPQVAIV